jgi:hypothetical protein
MRLPLQRLDVEYLDNETTTFGPDTRAGIIHDAANVGWSWYSRFPGAAFFTLKRESKHNLALVPGLSHIRVWYTNDVTGYGPELVFAGRLGDADESGDDVVWTAYDYLAELAMSMTGYRVMYERVKLSEIVKDEWQRDDASGKFANYGAKVRTKSLLAHVGTGVIQNPKNAGGVAEMRTEPQFGVISVPRLLLFFDLSEIGRANTTNNVSYEITRSLTPIFRFVTDAGQQRPEKRLMFPGNANDFRYRRGILNVRNVLATIGTKDGKAKYLKEERSGGTFGYNAFGRREDTFSIKTLSGYPHLGTDAGQFSAQKMITERAVLEAVRPIRALELDIANFRLPHAWDPFDGWDIEDQVFVELKDRKGPPIERWFRIVGVRGRMGARGYAQSVILQEPVTV